MLRSLLNKNKKKRPSINAQQKVLPPSKILNKDSDKLITGDLDVDIEYLGSILNQNNDFIIRHIRVLGRSRAVVMFFADLVDTQMVNTEIVKPLMYVPYHLKNKQIEKNELKDILLSEVLYHGKIRTNNHYSRIIDSLLHGETVILIDGLSEVIQIVTRKIDKRSIDSPETEQVILGPREGFIENILTNLSLLRYRLQTADFRVKTIKLGRLTKTTIAICYIEGIVNPDLVKEVEHRLSKVDIDIIMDIGYLEQYVEDNHFSPFPQVLITERPDKTVANLAEGRVAVLADGSPFALLALAVFNQFYQTIEDYSSRFLMGSFIRTARIAALVFSLIFPSLYVSFISFNPELLPTEFAVAISGGRAGVPFPAVIEVLVIEIAMEVLREATVRLPKQVGGALSIVGVLIIGQAAVDAGIASPITIVVIALTTIGSFATPAYGAAFALRMLRFPIVILAGLFGLYGVVIGIIVIFNHMLSIKSFGVPYMSPVSPTNFQGMKDVVFRSPLWWMRKRPNFLHTQNIQRTPKDATVQNMNNTHDGSIDEKNQNNSRGED